MTAHGFGTVELLLLAAEHDEVTPQLARRELGMERTARRLFDLVDAGLLQRHRHGVYRLAPAGLTRLVDIAEGRREDRFGLGRQIRAALAARAERAA